jgi:hypothetical protein
MSDVLITNFDAKLATFSSKLRDDLKISPPESNALASAIRAELRAADIASLPTLAGDSPLALRDRFHEINQLLSWLEQSSSMENQYGQFMALNYFCFVYLGQTCFTVLRKELPPQSIARRCCTYLTDNPVRAFRNALAHGNWRLTLDRSAVDFWARKGSDPTEPLTRFRFSEDDLHFSQYLAAATAYAVMLVL